MSGQETGRRTFSDAVGVAARGMTKAERRAYLRARGWTRTGADDWLPPGPPERGYSCYSLAAAIRVALADEEAGVTAVRTSRGHHVERDETGRILLFRNASDRRPLALTDGDLWLVALQFLGYDDGIVARINAEEAEQAERYGRDAFLWEKRRHRRDPKKDTP